MFARDLWNVSTRVALDLPRTTNGLEGWHSALGKSIKIDHPNIWVLTQQLKKESSGTLMEIAATQIAIETKAKDSRTKQYQKFVDKIEQASLQLVNGELAIMPFLRIAAQKIALST